MRLRDRIFDKNDIIKYKGLAAIANMKICQGQDKYLIPNFIVDEAISYFCSKEKYEVCASIQKFFQTNQTFIMFISRDEWYNNRQLEIKKH